MTSVAVGRQAEAAAAAFLERKGCQIIARNWRTRYCEIDIIAERQGVVYFCEVKYRASSRHGNGLAYITPQKLQRMRFAAHSWLHAHQWYGSCRLAAIGVGGPQFQVVAAVSDLPF